MGIFSDLHDLLWGVDSKAPNVGDSKPPEEKKKPEKPAAPPKEPEDSEGKKP